MNFLLSLVTSRLFPYLVVALLATGLIGAIYLKGVSDERNAQLIADLQEQNRFLLEDIARKKKAAEEDQAQAAEDADKIMGLEAKTKELLDELQNPDHQCLTGNDVDRLRKLWSPKAD